MIDPKAILTDFDRSVRRLSRKGVEAEELGRLRELLEQRRRQGHELDETRSSLNRVSDEIGKLMREGRADDAAARRATVADLKDRVASQEERLRGIDQAADAMLLRVPNFPADDAPEGTGEADNKVLRVHGYDKAVYDGKTFRPHWDIATALGIYDAERAAKISGSMFALLKNDGSRLLRALIQFGLDLNRDRYEEITPPHFVRTETFTATGHLPKFEIEAYKLRDDDLWAIPTGEVPLMSIHRNETLAGEELPKRYMAYTVCWRREAGSAGKDTRGMQRLHEFHKVELLKLCRPDQVAAEFDAMLADAERPLQQLGLPYRVVDLCTADLTFASARVFDLEVYAPGVDRWLEVSSVGIFTDFQARRASIRFKGGKGKPEFVHALNGSGMATPRVWAAILEHGAQPDGSVVIPEPLVRYMGQTRIVAT
jgi:seryl-tRNA synthetase